MKRCFPGNILLSFPLFVRVRPLQRPRTVQGRIYQPLEDQKQLRSLIANIETETIKCEFFLIANFFVKNKNPGDIDNMIKALLDALQSQGVIDNDRNCKGIQATLNPGDNLLLCDIHEALYD